MKEDYYHKKFDYEVEQEEIKHVEYLIWKQEKLKKDEEYRKKREEAEKAKLASLPNPNQDEIDLALNISSYLSKILNDYNNLKQRQEREQSKA